MHKQVEQINAFYAQTCHCAQTEKQTKQTHFMHRLVTERKLTEQINAFYAQTCHCAQTDGTNKHILCADLSLTVLMEKAKSCTQLKLHPYNLVRI